MTDILEKYKEVLTILKRYGVPGIIAGGAIRDYYFNKTPADIDVFVNCPLNAVRDEYLADIFDVHPEKVFNFPRVSSTHVNVLSVTNVEYKGLIIQVINLNIDPYVHVEHFFDIGICKAYFDLENGIHFTKDFHTDVNDNTFTVCGNFYNNPFGLHRTLTYHIPKLTDRYPDRKTIIDIDRINKAINYGEIS